MDIEKALEQLDRNRLGNKGFYEALDFLANELKNRGWISVKDRLPPRSFIESDDENVPYEAHMILMLIRHSEEEYDVMSGVYEEEDLSPFPNIPKWKIYVVTDDDSYWLEAREPTHWMPLPKPPKE